MNNNINKTVKTNHTCSFSKNPKTCSECCRLEDLLRQTRKRVDYLHKQVEESKKLYDAVLAKWGRIAYAIPEIPELDIPDFDKDKAKR